MTKKINKSPERGSFLKTNRLKVLEESNTTPETDDYFQWLVDYDNQKLELEQDPNWQKHNLEYDLRTTDFIIEKVKSRDSYAQNLYAALCNNQFIQLENSWDILKEEYWHCSWRYAGGIIADIQEHGDYMDWYCSGINGDGSVNAPNEYVSEGIVTDEIKRDLKKMGWVVIPYKDEENI